jgi:MFS family permease
MTGARSSLWRHADFLKLWSAQSISLLGTQVTALALPLTAILFLNATPMQVGLLASLQYLPFLLVSLPAGVIVDRVRRLPVLIATDLGRAVLLGVVPLAVWLGHLQLWLLYPVAFTAGVLSVLFDVAHQSYLPAIVDNEQLVEGNTKLQLSYSGAQLAGPGLGGVLVQLLTAPIAIAVDAASYLGSAVLLGLIRRPEPAPPPAADAAGLRGIGRDIRVGLRFVWRHPLIRPIALATGTANFFYLFGMTGAVLALYAVRVLGLSPAMLGVVFVFGNVGAVLGSLVADRVLARFRFGRVMLAGSVVSAVAIALMALATPATAVVQLAAAVLIGELGVTIYDISQISLRQAATPPALLGRMNATVRFVNWGPIPIGAFLGGVLGEALGLRTALWIAAAGSLLPAVPLLLSRVRSLRELPTQPIDADAPQPAGALTAALVGGAAVGGDG